MSTESVRFLRQAYRVSRKLPSQVIIRKFRFNAREAVEFYNQIGNAELATERLARGWKVLNVLERMLDGRDELVKEVFKPFQFMEPVETTKVRDVGTMTLNDELRAEKRKIITDEHN